MKTDLYIELDGKKTNFQSLVDTAKETWKSKGNKIKELNSLELYFKPDENICFCVYNGEFKEQFKT